MERTIRVTGKGKLAVKPDLIELTLSIKDIKKEYDELLKRSSSATNEVKELLEKIGFAAGSGVGADCVIDGPCS